VKFNENTGKFEEKQRPLYNFDNKMGCGQSKNQIGVAVQNDKTPRTPVKHRPNSKTIRVKQASELTDTNTVVENETPTKNNNSKKPKKLLSKRGTVGAWTGSQDSLGGGEVEDNGRGGSATSKFSQHSADSGFDGEDTFMQQIISEESDPNKVREIEQAWESPRDLDLGIVGKAVQQRSSAKDKERLEEQRILASLREEGLISRTVGKSGGGVCFEVVTDSSRLPPIQAPARLEKLEKRKKKKKKVTEADIVAKLEKAEARRKELEQERLAKIQQVSNKSDVQNALDSFAEAQKQKEVSVKSKEEIAAENREKRLREQQEKLRKKKEHAERVRQRKSLVPLDDPQQQQEEEAMRQKRISEDTPVGASVEA